MDNVGQPPHLNNAWNLNLGGNIGINTTTPQTTLDVNGIATVRDDINAESDVVLGSTSRILRENASVLSPVGSVIAYLGLNDQNNPPPSGWLFCDGKEYNVAGTYNRLFQVIGYTYGYGTGNNPLTSFILPDFRAAFLRGSGNNNNPDYAGYTGPDLNTFQLASVAQHTHTFNDAYLAVSVGGVQAIKYPNSVSNNGGELVTRSATTDGNNNSDMGRPGDNRPFNVGVNWIIKF
jgi:microcystin-dependent protein